MKRIEQGKEIQCWQGVAILNKMIRPVLND